MLAVLVFGVLAGLTSLEVSAGPVDYTTSKPALPASNPFTGVQSAPCWSSTPGASHAGSAWVVHLYDGGMDTYDKANDGYVWPVRGGQ